MPHHTPLITTLVVAIVLAFALGMAAHRLRVSPLVGYLLAGVLVGPFTPGFVADQPLANELADIGVILLLFAVGLHFSPRDLLSVRAVALPGALAEIVLMTSLGMLLAWGFGWGLGAGLVFGLSLSVASTVVLTRALQERRILGTGRGRTAVGWLVVEDIVVVLALVLLPAAAGALAGGGAAGSGWGLAAALGLTLAKVAAFVAAMLLVGRRVIPWVLHHAAHTGSRELFRLSVYAVALGVAYAASALFGVSFALGAFFAGMVLAESPLSQRATEEALPLRDAFAVLFFVSVGMLFDPGVLVRSPWAVLATVAAVVAGKPLAALLIVRGIFRRPWPEALSIAASLAQIGEFSFILAGLGVGLGLLPEEGRALVLAASILSILLNPLLFAAAERWHPRRKAAAVPPAPPAAAAPVAAGRLTEGSGPPVTALAGHDVLVGYGRVGALVGAGLKASGGGRRPLLVFEDGAAAAEAARRAGADEVVAGNAADPEVLRAANLGAARRLVVAIPEAFEAGQVVEQARAANPGLRIVARAHSEDAAAHLSRLGADLIVSGEREIARCILEDMQGEPGTGVAEGGPPAPPAPAGASASPPPPWTEAAAGR